MREHSKYEPAKFHFTEGQIKKIHKGHKVRLGHHQIGTGPHTLMLHPLQHKLISAAHHKGKGSDLHVSDGELAASINSGLHGTGIWDSIKNGLSSVWKYVKPALGAVGDAIAYSNPELAPLREGVRSITGVGIKHKKAHHKHHKHKKHHEYDSSSEEEEYEHKHKHHKKKSHHKKSHGGGLYL